MKCIVSFANRKGNYVKGLARLVDSLRNNFDGEVLAFIGEETVGAPKHQDNPYAFKIYAIQRAIDSGFTQILYLDSSCYAIKNVEPIFEDIKTNGFFAQYAGHICGSWANFYQLKYFGITREEAMTMPMYGNAGMLGLDLTQYNGAEFFNRWKESMLKGAFKGSWEDSRHDMTCGSIIANQMGLHEFYKKGDEWLQYAGVFDPVGNDTIIIKAQGL